MGRYLLSRKMIDINVIEWEKMHDKNQQKESLPMFIAKRQTEYLLNTLLENGFNPKEAKEELQKILTSQTMPL